jgi:hypothetical protein
MGNGIKKGESFKRVDVTNIVDKVAEKCSLPYAPNSLVE